MATQDIIAVDGWALNMLSRGNVSYDQLVMRLDNHEVSLRGMESSIDCFILSKLMCNLSWY